MPKVIIDSDQQLSDFHFESMKLNRLQDQVYELEQKISKLQVERHQLVKEIGKEKEILKEKFGASF